MICQQQNPEQNRTETARSGIFWSWKAVVQQQKRRKQIYSSILFDLCRFMKCYLRSSMFVYVCVCALVRDKMTDNNFSGRASLLEIMSYMAISHQVDFSFRLTLVYAKIVEAQIFNVRADFKSQNSFNPFGVERNDRNATSSISAKHELRH